MGDTGTITESTEGNNCSPWSAITVAAAPVPPPAVPVATLTNNGPISIGSSATLTYGCTNSTSASISSIGAVTPVAGGTRSTGALAATTNYDLTCTGPGGTRNAATTVTVGNPIAYIMATPDRVNSGATTLLSFSAANLTPSASCSVTGPSGTLWTGASSALGVLATTTSTSPAITKQSTFVISCDGASNLDNVIVNLVPRFEEF